MSCTMSISIEPVIFTDDAAESYTEGTIEVLDPVYDFFAAEIAKLVGKNARILDVGTGHGIVIGKVARLTGAETIGVDASPCILRKARAAYPNTSFQVHDASRLGFKDNSFDIVFSTLAFHHFDRPSALKEMLRVLKPSGTLIIFDFDGRIHPVLFASLLLRSGKNIARAIPILGWGIDSVFHSINEKAFNDLLSGLAYEIEHHGMFLKMTAKKPVNEGQPIQIFK